MTSSAAAPGSPLVSAVELADVVVPADSRAESISPGREAQPRRRSLVGGLVAEARPRQWVKNLLVAAAPGAAGVIAVPAVAGRTALAFLVFSLAASGTYFLNDARDVAGDRIHPVKRFRPIAAGVVPLRLAYVVAVALMATALLLCVAVRNVALLGTLVAYLVLTISYTLWLKHEAVVDMVAVAFGFVLRAIAGAAAVHLPISVWFLIVTSFGSMLMVSGKRYAEFLEMGEGRAQTRASLGGYTASYLRFVWSLSAAVAIMTYCLWAFEVGSAQTHAFASKLSILPFVVGVMRYAYLIDQGKGSAPEDVVLGDRQLQVIGLLWAAVFLVGVYS